MASLTTCQWVIASSIVVSAVICVGFLAAWSITGDLRKWCYDAFLFYGLFFVTSNVPRLILAGFEADHHPVHIVFSMLGTLFLLLGAFSWACERPTRLSYVLFLVPALIGLVLHYWFGMEFGGAIYGAVMLGLIVITVYYARRDAPLWVCVVLCIAFLAWVFMSIQYPDTGDPVGHALGISTKVLVAGAIVLSFYERLHRDLQEAAGVRKAAIEIIAGDITDCEEIADATRQLIGISGSGQANRANC